MPLKRKGDPHVDNESKSMRKIAKKAGPGRDRQENAEVVSDRGPHSSSSGGSSDSYPTDSSSEGATDSGSNDSLQVDFRFFPPADEDYHSCRALLQPFLEDREWNLSQFTNLVVGQTHVGTVVKTSGAPDALGVMTCLPLAQLPQECPDCCKPLLDFLIDKCADSEIRERIKRAFRDSSCGLVVSERLMNLPDEVAKVLVQSLQSDIEEAAVDKGLDKEERLAFSGLDSLLVLSRAYREPQSPIPNNALPAGVVFTRFEDEAFSKAADWSFCFSSMSTAVGKKELQPVRLVMMIKMKQFKSIANSFGEPERQG